MFAVTKGQGYTGAQFRLRHENVDCIVAAVAGIRKDVPDMSIILHISLSHAVAKKLCRGFRELRTGIRLKFAKLFQHIDSRVDPKEFVEAGDHVVVIARLHGRVQSNNKQFDMTAVHVWTLRHGKAVRFEVYIDTPKMLKALEKEM